VNPSPVDVLFALVGDVCLSSRALRQLRWLSEEGLTVEALSFGPQQTARIADGVHLTVLERPAGTGPLFFWRAHRLFRKAALGRRARLYQASDLYTLPALSAAARRHGGRLSFDSRELYPHVDATAGKPWATLLWSRLEHRFVPRCDAVFTVNESIAERLERTYRIPSPVVVYNVAAPATAGSGRASQGDLGMGSGQPIVLYQGLFHAGRGLETLIEAMTHVPDATLVLIGDGPIRDAVVRMAADRLGNRCQVLPFTPPDVLRRLTGAADVGVHVPDPISESVRLALPNKLFEYLAADVPVVVSDLPEMGRVVRRFDVGLTVPPQDVTSLAQALQRALFDAALRERWLRHIPAVFEAYDPAEDRRRFIETVRRLLR